MKSSSTKSIQQFFVACVLLCCSHILSGQTWTSMPGLPGAFSPSPAMDISIGKTGAIWASSLLGTYRWNGSNWELNGKPSIRIAVDPQGAAWLISPAGQIYQYNLVSKNWELRSGTAKDIAVGADGSVWIIGSNIAPGGYDIYKWNGSDWNKMPGGAVRVAVDPSGNAWVVNSFNQVFHYEANDFVVKPALAKDIGVGADGSVWLSAPDDKIYKWVGNNWQLQTGAASQIAVGPDGNAWTINSAGQISHTNYLRAIFARNGEYEYKMLQALRVAPYCNNVVIGAIPAYSNLEPLGKAFGRLGLLSAEVYFSTDKTITAEQALSQIGSFNDEKVRKSVYGILATLVMAEVIKKSDDAQTTALRSWVTDLYRGIRIRSAKASLDEYAKWKRDWCTYEGISPERCRVESQGIVSLFSQRKPPQDLIGKNALGMVLGSHRDEVASGVSIGVAALGISAAGIALTAALTAEVTTLPAYAAVYTTIAQPCLLAAFGGGAEAVTVGTTTTTVTGSIGATGWASVVAAPIAAAVMCIVVGTIQGFAEVEAARVEPMFKMKLGAAMSDYINVKNIIADPNSRAMFFIAFEEAASQKFIITKPQVDGEVRFYCQAGYVSQFGLSYDVNGQHKEFTTSDLPVGQEKSFAIPYNATNIRVQGWYALGGWKKLFNQTLAGPTYACYTSFGTIADPDYKTDCPEIGNMTTKKNELVITQGGGYTAWIKLTYSQNGTTVTPIWRDGLAIGWHKVFIIPEDATNIHLEIQAATGWVGEPWKTIVDKTWLSPPSECIKVYGTTLDPKSNGECN